MTSSDSSCTLLTDDGLSHHSKGALWEPLKILTIFGWKTRGATHFVGSMGVGEHEAIRDWLRSGGELRQTCGCRTSAHLLHQLASATSYTHPQLLLLSEIITLLHDSATPRKCFHLLE